MKPLEIKKGIYPVRNNGATEVSDGIYWVGAVDWAARNFHGHTYTTQKGTTYNAYLIVDEKIALVDTVYGPFASELIARIREVIPPEKIDYVIANHVETDHSGALPEIMKLASKAKVVGTAKCKEGLYRNYYKDWDFQAVRTGDKINLGRRNLTFVEAPMIHWPDSMFTCCPEEELLMPNDAFGQHYATNKMFDDEVDMCALMDEALKYYANILWPLGPVILKKIEDVLKMGISIKMIAPSHGIIWRKDPGKIINVYLGWTKNITRKKVVIIYETMWGATEKMARRIMEGVTDAGAEGKLYNIAQSDHTEVVSQMFDAKGFMAGSSTHDNDMLPNLAGFLEFLKGLKPKGRLGGAFGSFGWGGGAVASVEKALEASGVEMAKPSVSCRFMPDPDDSKACYEYGVNFVKKMDAE